MPKGSVLSREHNAVATPPSNASAGSTAGSPRPQRPPAQARKIRRRDSQVREAPRRQSSMPVTTSGKRNLFVLPQI